MTTHLAESLATLVHGRITLLPRPARCVHGSPSRAQADGGSARPGPRGRSLGRANNVTQEMRLCHPQRSGLRANAEISLRIRFVVHQHPRGCWLRCRLGVSPRRGGVGAPQRGPHRPFPGLLPCESLPYALRGCAVGGSGSRPQRPRAAPLSAEDFATAPMRGPSAGRHRLVRLVGVLFLLRMGQRPTPSHRAVRHPRGVWIGSGWCGPGGHPTAGTSLST